MTIASFGLIVLTVFLVSFALTALGFAIAWPWIPRRHFTQSSICS